MVTAFEKKVYNAIKHIPKGKVTTYAAVARAIKNPRSGRAVGNALNKNPFNKKDVPCHRVVCSDGRAGGYAGGESQKIVRLRREGVRVEKGRVSLAKYFWFPWKKKMFLK